MSEDSLHGAPKVAGDLMMEQEALREIVAHCLDLLTSYETAATEGV